MLNSLRLKPRVVQGLRYPQSIILLSRLFLVQYRRTLECLAPQNKRLLASNTIYFPRKRLFHLERHSVVYATFPGDCEQFVVDEQHWESEKNAKYQKTNLKGNNQIVKRYQQQGYLPDT
jgi:hypothetical protein